MINSFIIKNKFFTAAALLLSCCFVCSCENSQKEIDALIKNQPTREEAIGVTSYMSTEGKMKAKLTAPVMYRVEPKNRDTIFMEFPRSLHVDFYNDSAQIESRLDAKYAKYYENQEKVYLRDSVVVITVKGDTLRTPDLWWDQHKGIFYTDKYAEYRAKDQDLNGGKGLYATQDLKTVTFKDPTGNMQLQGGGIGK